MASSSATYTSLVDYLTVLPRAHVRLGDVRWQYAVYDLFHFTPLARLTHGLGMTPNTGLWMMLGSLLLPGPIDGGLVVAGLVLALAASYDRLAALVLVPLLALLWFAGQTLLGAWGADALAYTLAGAALFAGLQSFGHAKEPIPPPWSGSNRFVPFRTFLRTAPWWRIATIPSMALCGAVLEFWAAPRLLPVQVLKLLVALGYRPELRAACALRTRAYAEDIRYAIEDRLPATPAGAAARA